MRLIYPQSSFPDAQDAVTLLGKKCVLLSIKLSSVKLSGSRIGEHVGVSVPVIPIELDDQEGAREKRIDNEPMKENHLLLVPDSEPIENAVADPLKLGWRQPPNVLQQVLPARRIGVPAPQRAVGRIALCNPRWRPAEGTAAHLTNELKFLAALPLVVACVGTERLWVSEQLTFLVVDWLATVRTRHLLAQPTRRLRGGAVTRKRAELSSGRHVARNRCATMSACDSAQLVPCRTFHLCEGKHADGVVNGFGA